MYLLQYLVPDLKLQILESCTIKGIFNKKAGVADYNCKKFTSFNATPSILGAQAVERLHLIL